MLHGVPPVLVGWAAPLPLVRLTSRSLLEPPLRALLSGNGPGDHEGAGGVPAEFDGITLAVLEESYRATVLRLHYGQPRILYLDRVGHARVDHVVAR